jgi:Flp pilus assembly protein TadD
VRERELKAALAFDPHNADALHELGIFELARGDAAAARVYLSRALTVNPDDEDAKRVLAGQKGE